MPQQSADVLALLSTWSNNFTTQTTKAVIDLRAQDYVRLVIIIGAYCLLRPYLIKLGARVQRQQHEAACVTSEQEKTTSGATGSANNRRTPGADSSDEDEDEDAWGQQTRLRQRRLIRRILEAQENEADSDEEIKEFLVD